MLDVMQHGFAGGAPELRYTPGGDAVANVRVGSTDRWVDHDTGDEKERTTWIGWECWGKSGENLAKYVKRGSQVLITGTIRNDSWEDTKTGEKRFRDRYIVNRWRLLDRKPKEAGDAGGDNGPGEYPSGGAAPSDHVDAKKAAKPIKGGKGKSASSSDPKDGGPPF